MKPFPPAIDVCIVYDKLSPATREAERTEQTNVRNRFVIWRKLVRNRIAFRHDERRGPISATLTGAVY